MDKYDVKFTRLQARIFRLLCVRVGGKLNKREIAGILGVSATAVGKALVGMEDFGFVKVGRVGKMNLAEVGLNRDSEIVIWMKRLENLKMVGESGIVGFLEERFPGCAVILFGSYGFGDDTVRSDVDLAVVGCKGKVLNLKKFDEFFEREVRVNFYDSFGDVDECLRSNLFNGVVLAGRISHEEV